MKRDFRKPKRGFTLMEVMITLCVFVLLSAAVFGIFTATLKSASSLEDNQKRSDQVESLTAWFRQEMLDLPARGTIQSYHRDTLPFHVAGLVWGADEDLQAIDLQLQANGEYLLRIAAYQPASSTSSQHAADLSPFSIFMTEIINNNATLAWRPLVRDLKLADWRFRQFNQIDWQNSTSGAKPVMVELTFQPGGMPAAVTGDFWIPPTQPSGNLAAAPAPVVTTNP